jgi:hypothetical protein
MQQTELDQLKARITALEARNKRVEMDKAWEVSWIRKLTIMSVTYVIVVTFLFFIGNSTPFIYALVPPVGFFLSTLVVSDLKKQWIKGRY